MNWDSYELKLLNDFLSGSLFEQFATQAKELVKETTRQSSQDGLLAHVDKVRIEHFISVSTILNAKFMVVIVLMEITMIVNSSTLVIEFNVVSLVSLFSCVRINLCLMWNEQ